MRRQGALTEQGLTELQERFCQEFIIDLKGKASAMRAGYSEKTAAVKACRMLRQKKIQDRIAHLKNMRMRQTGMTQKEVLREWAVIGTFNAKELFTPEGKPKLPSEWSDEIGHAVSGFKVKRINRRVYKVNEDTPEEEEVTYIEDVIEVKLNDKHTALNNMAKHLNMYREDNEGKGLKTVTEILEHLKPTVGPPGENDAAGNGVSLLPGG